MKRVAIAGFGFMGRMHYGNWRKIRGVRVAAICDANLARLASAETAGNLAGADTSTDFTGIAVHDDFAEMLAAGGFDIVDVTLPTPLHADMTVAALRAGYHVLCEKPMALTVADCDRMLAAARKADRLLLVAHCLRFWPEYVTLKRLIDSGKYGRVVAADFFRCSDAPDPRGGHGWFLDERKSGGCLLDLHVHDADMIAFLFGRPEKVDAAVHRRADGVLDHVQARYVYPDKVVTGTGSWAASKSHAFEAAFRVMLEGATIEFDTKRETPYLVFPQKGRPFVPKIPAMNAYEAEQRYFIDCLSGRADGTFLTARDARDTVAMLKTLNG